MDGRGFEDFFSNVGIATCLCTIMVVTGRLMSDYYFYYILVSLFVVTVGLVSIRTMADNHHKSNYLTDEDNGGYW